MICNCCQGNVNYLPTNDQFMGNPLLCCDVCGHVQLHSLPATKELKGYYEGQYSSNRSRYLGEAYFDIMKKRAKAQYDYIVSNVNEDLNNGSVIDLGAGYGYLLREFERNNFNVQGVEYDPLCIGFCNKRI